MKRYAYKVEAIRVGRIGFLNDSKKQTKQLDTVGEDGWELITVSTGRKYLKYIYARELAEGEQVPKTSQKANVSPLQRYIVAMVLFVASIVSKLFTMQNLISVTISLMSICSVLAVATTVMFILQRKNPNLTKAFSILTIISTLIFLFSTIFIVA